MTKRKRGFDLPIVAGLGIGLIALALVGFGVLVLFALGDEARTGEAHCYVPAPVTSEVSSCNVLDNDCGSVQRLYDGRFSRIRFGSDNFVSIWDEQGRQTIITNGQCLVTYDVVE